MRRVVFAIAVCVLTGAVWAQKQTDDQVKVRLVMVETLALRDGKTVPGLTKADFQVTANGTIQRLDTLDYICPEGETGDAASDAAPAPAPNLDRRIVFLFDYVTLTRRDQIKMLDQTAQMIKEHKTPGEQMMIAAIADRLRIEQRFTTDPEELLDTLQRMEFDRTLWSRDNSGRTAKEYFEQLATLMDVLAAHGGAKAVVTFSSAELIPGQTKDMFRDVAMRAAAGRTVFYPVWFKGQQFANPAGDPRGIRVEGETGVRTLSKLAIDTGGRPVETVDNPAIPYQQAQRDLSCRYALGFYVDGDRVVDPQALRVSAGSRDIKLLFPRDIKLWTPEEQRLSRLRAAFAEPEQFENSLVRTLAFPTLPVSGKRWETLLGINFPMPMGRDKETVAVEATLSQAGRELGRYEMQMNIDPLAQPGPRPVTIYGDAEIQPGPHAFTVALSRPGAKQVVSNKVEFVVPQVPAKGLFVRGPLLARVVPDGILVREVDGDRPIDTNIEELMEQGKGFEPLLVHEIAPSDTLLAYWVACQIGKGSPGGATVVRRFLDEDGKVAHELEAIKLDLKSSGKSKIRCQNRVEKLDGGTLSPGEYTLQVAVRDGGTALAEQSAPLLVDD